MDILKQLKQGKPFSGRNGTLVGRIEPQSVENDILHVVCDKDGLRWHEDWDLQDTIWGFERKDYYFL